MTRLLNKPLKSFIVFTILVLAGSIPVYFYLVESIWIDELDDHNQHVKEQIATRFNEPGAVELDKKIALWNEVQAGSQIAPAAGLRSDSVYLVEREIMGKQGLELERYRGLRAVMMLNGKPYAVTIETNVEEVHETVMAISVITCGFMLLLILGFILLNRHLSKRLWAPFTDTLKKLKQFDLNSAGALDLNTTDIREFAELNETLAKLIYNNVRVYQQQKEFAQNASHELQTPLALLKTKLDLLIQDASLSTGQRQIIESLDQSVSRMTRINKNLLLLAGIENKNYSSETIDLTALVRSVRDNFVDFAAGKGCHISLSAQESVSISANESLVESMVSNLLSNTVRHGINNTAISVMLNSQSLTVANKGQAALDANNLFRRFIPASAGNPGTGLGLAIVKEIADKYGWNVSYTFQGDHHIFSVSF